jgi:hypothetical protein
MIGLTVLCNLPPVQDEDEFLQWRLGVYSPDRESFERGFYSPQVRADIEENLEKVSDPLLLVSECLIDESNQCEVGG